MSGFTYISDFYRYKIYKSELAALFLQLLIFFQTTNLHLYHIEKLKN